MASTDDLKEQLSYILSEVAKIQNIKNFEVNPNTKAILGDGFIAQFYRGDVRNKCTGESTAVAIKKAPPAISPEMSFGPIFKNEDIFYKVIFPILNDLQTKCGVLQPFNNLPKYFCGGLEPDRQYIAMEDVKPFGYVMFDKKQCWDREHLEMIFKTYGKFHALSYVLRKNNKEEYDTLCSDIIDITGQMEKFVEKPMTAAVSAAINALDSDTDKAIYDVVEDLKTNALQNYLRSLNYTGEHRCLTHGDCWSNNMLFKYSESGKLLDMKIIDFQLCRDKTPIHDLSYLFYAGAAKKDMDDLDNYLRIYYTSFTDFAKELGANPEEIFSYELLQSEWKEYGLYGIILGIYLWQIKLTPKEDYLHVVTPSEDKKTRPLEETMKLWEVLLDKIHKNTLYIERTTDILRHAVEYGVITKDIIVKKTH